jgi:hypothetical protein
MKLLRASLAWIALALFITAVVLAVFLGEQSVWRIELVLASIGAIASLLTLVIAVLLFGKFGAEQSVLDRQLAAIEGLLASMRKFNFLFSGDHRAIRIDAMNPNPNPNAASMESFYSSRIGVTLKIANAMECISEHRSRIFLPGEISDSLLALTCASVSKSKDLLDDTDELLVHLGAKLEDVLGDNMNGEALTVLRLITALEAVHDAIEAWCALHSSLEFTMNLRPHYRVKAI